MSIQVFLDDLEEAVGQRGSMAFVLAVGDSGAPHVVQAEVVNDAGRLVATIRARTAANAGSRPHVTVLWPARHLADYSLIVDAVARVVSTPTEAQLLLSPTRAVLHRPAPAPDPTASPCGSDCVPVALTEER